MNTKEPPNRNRETDDKTDSGALISRGIFRGLPSCLTGRARRAPLVVELHDLKEVEEYVSDGATGDIAFMDKMLKTQAVAEMTSVVLKELRTSVGRSTTYNLNETACGTTTCKPDILHLNQFCFVFGKDVDKSQ